jgi:O-antigen/teichoic acid export membrane protein
MPYWLAPIFGESFAPAFGPAVILLVAGALGVPGSIAGAMLSASGRPGLRSLSMVCAAVINVGILIFSVPAFGAVGAAVATLAGNLVASNMNLIILHRSQGVALRDFYGVRKQDFLAIMRAVKRGNQRRVTADRD